MVVNPKRVAKGMYWDRALSLIMGCMPISEGCMNCWSAREAHIRANHPHPGISKRYKGLTKDGRYNGKVRYHWLPLAELPKVKKPLVWSVWNDLFHIKVEPDFINTCFKLFEGHPEQTIIVLTKRIKRAYKLIHSRAHPLRPIPDNVILGTTVELPEYSDRIDALLGIPAKCRMVSLEPILNGLDISRYLNPYGDCDSHTQIAIRHGLLNEEQADSLRRPALDWVIIGGENAPLRKARPCYLDWILPVVNQCRDTGVACFVKQTGTAFAHRHGYRDRVGRDMSEWPEQLRVRQFPERRA
jgi:protein gp37